MGVKIPGWLFAVVGLAAFSGSVGFGYWLATRGEEGRIEQIEQKAAADSAALDSAVTFVVAAYEDSLREARAVVETLTVKIPVAVETARERSATLVTYLSANEDTVGLRLFREDEAGDSTVLALTVAKYDARLRIKDLEIGKRDSLVTFYSRALAEVRIDLRDALGEGKRWRAKANPPWLIELGGDVLEAGLIGTAAWLLSDDEAVGIGTGAAALGIKQLPKIGLRIPFL